MPAQNGLPEPTASGSASGSDIARQFVKEYYSGRTPVEQLHNFYHADSELTRVDPDAPADENSSVSGIDAIAKKLQSIGTRKMAVDSIDVQGTTSGSILIVLTGISAEDSGADVRAFSQTIVLAQEQGRYFVRNDCLRYLSKMVLSSVCVATAPASASAEGSNGSAKNAKSPRNDNSTQTAKTISAEVATSTPVAASASTATSTDDKAAPAPKEDTAEPKMDGKKKEKQPRTRKKKEREPKKEANEGDDKDAGAKPAPVEAAPADEPSKEAVAQVPVANSWADRLRLSAGPAAAVPLPVVAKENKKPAKKDTKEQKERKPREAKDGEAKPAKKERKGSSAEAVDKETALDVNAIYVANLNKPIKKEDVKALFQPFGEVTEVQTVSQKNFCFVRFTSPDSVDNVLNAHSSSPLVLDDATLNILRKKATPPREPKSNSGEQNGRSSSANGNRNRAPRGGEAGGPTRPPVRRSKESKEAGSKAPATGDDGFTAATRRNRRPKPKPSV